MPWPYDTDLEPRAGYTDTITEAIVSAAANAASAGYLAGLEIAAGQLARAFAAARPSGQGAGYFTPDVLASIGRNLVEKGEALWWRTGTRFSEVVDYTPPTRAGGAYVVTGGQPDAPTIVVAADRVFRVRWNYDPTLQRGVSPLGMAQTLRDLTNKLEASMATEANAVVGYLLPIPTDGGSGTVTKLREDLKNLQGRIAVVETARGGWGQGQSEAPRRDFELARMGPNYPEGNVQLYQVATEAVLAACGYPVQLWQRSDGTAQREAWRRYLHGTVAPLGTLVEAAASVARIPVQLGWDALFASDIQGRARAFQSLVGGGMSITEAAAASGILEPED